MANLKAIRIRISSFKSTRQITSAMKMVSAAKLRKAQDKIVRLRPYANKLHDLLVDLSLSLSDSEIENVYGRVSAPEKVLVVVITSNRGLCGAFNTNVIKEARNRADFYAGKQVDVFAIGKKGNDILTKTLSVVDNQSQVFDHLTFENVT